MSNTSIVPEGDRLWKVPNSSLPSNTYICATSRAGDCFLVDPGFDVASIDSALEELALRPRFIFCTHGHFDHVGGASFFQKKYGAKVFLHTDDLRILKGSNFLLMAMKLPQRIEIPELQVVVDEEFAVKIDGEVLKYHATAGHTPGSCVLQFRHALFTGDTLFSRGVGLSRLPGGDPDVLRASLRAVWERFPAESIVYPGHGEAAAFGWIKENNHELLRFMAERDLSEPEFSE